MTVWNCLDLRQIRGRMFINIPVLTLTNPDQFFATQLLYMTAEKGKVSYLETKQLKQHWSPLTASSLLVTSVL